MARTTRRKNGTGTRPWWNDKAKRFEVKITDPHNPNKRYTVTSPDEDEAARKAKARLRALQRGGPSAPARPTVESWLKEWLAEVEQQVRLGERSPGTLVSYRDIANIYVIPALGSRTLAALTPGDVEDMVANLKRQNGEPASGNTKRLARSTLRRALRRAQAKGLVPDNVAAIAEGPSVSKTAKPKRSMTVEQARKLLTAIRGHRFEAAIVLALGAGLRRGEALGLNWPNVDLETGTVTVARKVRWQPRDGHLPGRIVIDEFPKTEAGLRTIHLAPAIVTLLKTKRTEQAAERLASGSLWVGAEYGDLVTVSDFGRPVDPNNFRRAVITIAAQANLGDVTPHDLRHSAASILIALGVPDQHVAWYLGHADVSVTRRYYTHALGHESESTGAAMSALFDA